MGNSCLHELMICCSKVVYLAPTGRYRCWIHRNAKKATSCTALTTIVSLSSAATLEEEEEEEEEERRGGGETVRDIWELVTSLSIWLGHSELEQSRKANRARDFEQQFEWININTSNCYPNFLFQFIQIDSSWNEWFEEMNINTSNSYSNFLFQFIQIDSSLS